MWHICYQENYKILMFPCEHGKEQPQRHFPFPRPSSIPFDTGLRREAGALVPVSVARRLNRDHMKACRRSQLQSKRIDSEAGWAACAQISSAHQHDVGAVPSWIHRYVDPSHRPYLIGGAVFCPRCISIATEPTHHGRIGSWGAVLVL